MDAVRQPRSVSKADVPDLSCRVREVFTDVQGRSAWEVVVHLIGLVLIVTVSSFIWGSTSSVGQKVIELSLVLAVVAVPCTAILVKLRFRE
jgi:hypothetical protein